jgi:hypothetical protein
MVKIAFNPLVRLRHMRGNSELRKGSSQSSGWDVFLAADTSPSEAKQHRCYGNAEAHPEAEQLNHVRSTIHRESRALPNSIQYL